MKTQIKPLKNAVRRTAQRLMSKLPRNRSNENVVPMAIGAFVLGAAAGVLATLYLPKLLASDFVRGLGPRLNQATSSVGQSLNQAKDAVIGKVKEVASDRGLKSTLPGGNNGVENSDTMSPSRLA